MKATALMVGFVVFCSVAHADLRSDAEMMGKKVTDGMKAKDFDAISKAIKAAVTPDFQYVEDAPGKPQTFSQMFANLKMALSQMGKITVASAKILSLKQHGSSAWVKTEHTIGSSMMGPGKKSHTMLFIATSDDTYVKTHGKWKMSKMVMKTQKSLMDGKPMPMPTAKMAN